VERQGVLIDFDVTALWVRDQHACSTPKRLSDSTNYTNHAHLSVAIFKRAIDIKSSWLAALLPPLLVSGVLAPLAEPVVDDWVGSLLPDATFFAAFSANLFCFEAEGAIICCRTKVKIDDGMSKKSKIRSFGVLTNCRSSDSSQHISVGSWAFTYL
jgi:hypothetical protein